MTEKLRQKLDDDTPAGVNVPNDWKAIIVWAIGRWGGGIIMAAAAIWGLTIVYQDMRRDLERNRQIRTEEVQKSLDTAQALYRLAAVLEKMESRIE